MERHPTTRDLAEDLRRAIARRRDALVGRQRRGYSARRAALIDALARDYDEVLAIAIRAGAEEAARHTAARSSPRLRSMASRASEAAAAAIAPRLGPAVARERMAQTFSVLLANGADVLVREGLPSFAALARVSILGAREERYGGVRLTEREVDDLARAAGAAIAEHLAVECPDCHGTGAHPGSGLGGPDDCDACGGSGSHGRGEPLAAFDD